MRTPTTRRTRAGVAAPAVAIGLLVLAGCGSGNGSSSASDSGSTSGMTVGVADAGGMNVLTTSSGATLYISDQEKGKVLCSSSACEAIWTPLTVSAGKKPTASGAVASELTTLKRPDGSTQVAYEGSPLYTFSFDHADGDVNGDGVTDSFDGTQFTWHAATTTGAAPSPSRSPRGYGNGY